MYSKKKLKFKKGAINMYIDEATDFTLKAATGNGIVQALSNLTFGRNVDGLYDAVIGCEWDAQSVADAINFTPDLTHGNWFGRRTLPRKLVLQGEDSFGNIQILYVVLSDDEYDMCEGFELSVSLTNPARVPLALSNICSHKHIPEDLKDYFYDVADVWSAEAFAEAANNAYYDEVIYDQNWKAYYTRDNKCAIKGRDSLGNEHTIIIEIC